MTAGQNGVRAPRNVMVKIQNREVNHVSMRIQDWAMIPHKELDVILQIVLNGQHGHPGATATLKENANVDSKVPQR